MVKERKLKYWKINNKVKFFSHTFFFTLGSLKIYQLIIANNNSIQKMIYFMPRKQNFGIGYSILFGIKRDNFIIRKCVGICVNITTGKF